MGNAPHFTVDLPGFTLDPAYVEAANRLDNMSFTGKFFALSLPQLLLKFFFSGSIPIAAQAGPSHVAPTVMTGAPAGTIVPTTGEDNEEEEDEEDDEEDEGEVEIINQHIIAPSPPLSRIATQSQGSLQQCIEVVIPTHTLCIHLLGPKTPPPSTPKRRASSCRGRTLSCGKALQARVASPPSPSATSPLREPKLPTIHNLVPNINAKQVQIISDHLQNLLLVSFIYSLVFITNICFSRSCHSVPIACTMAIQIVFSMDGVTTALGALLHVEVLAA